MAGISSTKMAVALNLFDARLEEAVDAARLGGRAVNSHDLALAFEDIGQEAGFTSEERAAFADHMAKQRGDVFVRLGWSEGDIRKLGSLSNSDARQLTDTARAASSRAQITGAGGLGGLAGVDQAQQGLVQQAYADAKLARGAASQLGLEVKDLQAQLSKAKGWGLWGNSATAALKGEIQSKEKAVKELLGQAEVLTQAADRLNQQLESRAGTGVDARAAQAPRPPVPPEAAVAYQKLERELSKLLQENEGHPQYGEMLQMANAMLAEAQATLERARAASAGASWMGHAPAPPLPVGSEAFSARLGDFVGEMETAVAQGQVSEAERRRAQEAIRDLKARAEKGQQRQGWMSPMWGMMGNYAMGWPGFMGMGSWMAPWGMGMGMTPWTMGLGMSNMFMMNRAMCMPWFF